MKIKFIILLVIFSSIIKAQVRNPAEIPEVKFKVEKYKGSIDKLPITMLLTFYPDSSIKGYYYYDKVGRLFSINNLDANKNFELQAEQIELLNSVKPYDKEIFAFHQKPFLDNETLKGEWTYKGRSLPVNLTRQKSKIEWRLLRYKSTGYFINSYFYEQTKDYSIIYPSVLSSPNLNMYFLDSVFSLDRNMIDFINSSQSNYLLIEQNFGDNTTDSEYCCWSDDVNAELVYISDSILTYCKYGFTYAYYGFYHSNNISINTASGEVYTLKKVIREEFIDSVLTLLRNKSKNRLQPGDISPSPSDYTEDTDIYISKGGIYFSGNGIPSPDYYDLFLSFGEICNYLNTSFKNTMGLH